jgi:ketosteroid isomerase-like protein
MFVNPIADIAAVAVQRKVKMSKWLVLTLALSLPVASFAAACPSQPKTEAALLDLERFWAQALQKHDADTVSCFLADEFQDAGVEGELNSRAATLARIPKRGPNQNRLEDLHAHIYGEAAYVRGLNQVSDPSGKPLARVRFTDIFVYRDNRWLAVAGHETLMPDEKH